jgi:arylsulfatase A-like enzyme
LLRADSPEQKLKGKLMSKFSRRDFMVGFGSLMGAGLGLGLLAGCESSDQTLLITPFKDRVLPTKRPNILLVLSDEYNRPPKYPDGSGMPQGLREILGFERSLSANNQFTGLFPGFTRLRKNAVAFRKHYTASAACVPSRATMLTGQYPTVHGVSQTTGFFKDPSDPGFTFLDPQGVPTVGDWFQAAGYETYYFGKWHVSESCDDLGPWGFPFAKWDGPEPHGSDPANLGVYRDREFADNTIEFLNAKGDEPDAAPWFAVTSYLAPHDISGWPVQWFLPGGTGVQNPPIHFLTPPPIPGQGAISNPGVPLAADAASDCPPPTSDPVPLNPGGYPAGIFNPVPTLNEDLTTKPDCQYDMSVKIGLCQKSILPAPLRPVAPNPFQLTGDKFDDWCTAYGEWWTYQHYLLDIQLNRVFQALDQNGLKDNTIVIFTCDHGDYGGAHGGMVQKWHTAYEEAIHVPFVVSSPLINPTDEIREFDMPTSHVDLLPTLLGLAGFSNQEQEALRQKIAGHSPVLPAVGANVSEYIYNPSLTTPIPDPNGEPRPGILFMTTDEISQMTSLNPNNAKFAAFQTFLTQVNLAKIQLPRLTEGPIRQPNLVRSLVEGTWKYSRYYDPNGVEADQYEMYNLNTDPIEAVNLLDFKTGQVRAGVTVPGVSPAELEAQRALMAAQLAEQEALLL